MDARCFLAHSFTRSVYSFQDRITLPWSDAFFHVQEKSPGVDPDAVLEMLKKMDRVKFNEVNQVFTYEVRSGCFVFLTPVAPTNAPLQPEIVLRTQSDLRSHIRTNTTWEKTHGVPYKALRELVPQGLELTSMIDELEKDGQILILRSLTGKLKDAPLPELGRENAWGERLNAGGPERWRTIFWDDLKERNRTAPRAEDGAFRAWKSKDGTDSRVHLRVGGRAHRRDGRRRQAARRAYVTA